MLLVLCNDAPKWVPKSQSYEHMFHIMEKYHPLRYTFSNHTASTFIDLTFIEVDFQLDNTKKSTLNIQ